jgi:hypothetical protein
MVKNVSAIKLEKQGKLSTPGLEQGNHEAILAGI